MTMAAKEPQGDESETLQFQPTTLRMTITPLTESNSMDPTLDLPAITPSLVERVSLYSNQDLLTRMNSVRGHIEESERRTSLSISANTMLIHPSATISDSELTSSTISDDVPDSIHSNETSLDVEDMTVEELRTALLQQRHELESDKT